MSKTNNYFLLIFELTQLLRIKPLCWFCVSLTAFSSCHNRIKIQIKYKPKIILLSLFYAIQKSSTRICKVSSFKFI